MVTDVAQVAGDTLLSFAKSETPGVQSGVIWASAINCVQVLPDGALFVHVPGQSFRFDDSAEIMDTVIDVMVDARRDAEATAHNAQPVLPSGVTATAGAPGPDTNQNPEPKVMQ
ncbi:MAG: hypothetical protein KAS72_13545 [Phycisphaerales bacterium]|nr:hypothetical protein [Phycisphaerales bacterium]